MATAMNRQIKMRRQHLDVLAGSAALQSPEGYLQQRRKAVEMLQNRLISAQNMQLSKKQQRFIAMTAKLDAMSPLKVLTRGYAMAQKDGGEIVRSVSQINPGDAVRVSLADGAFTATVTDKKERAL
jgi:exodeoxyribonuclease VII large subunit